MLPEIQIKDANRFRLENYIVILLITKSNKSCSKVFPLNPLSMLPEVQGHRGAGLLAPENTEESFSYAVENNYDAVEMDLWVTKDNKVWRYFFSFSLYFLKKYFPKVVVLHGGAEGIEEPNIFTLEELHQQASQVPLLYDVLDILSKGNLFVQLELKGPLTDPEQIISIVSDTFGTSHVRISEISFFFPFSIFCIQKERVQFSGFNPEKLVKMKELIPEIPRSLTFGDFVPEDWLDQVKSVGACYVDFRFSCVTRELVKVQINSNFSLSIFNPLFNRQHIQMD